MREKGIRKKSTREIDGKRKGGGGVDETKKREREINNVRTMERGIQRQRRSRE